MMRRVVLIGAFFILAAAILPRATLVRAQAVPQTMSYAAYLYDNEGKPLNGAYTIRFSFWRSADAQAIDRTASGAINLSAPNFIGWQERHTVTPNAKGQFTVQLGSINPLPAIESLPPQDIGRLHLQIDVKNAASPDTAFELLDQRPSDPAIDRSPMLPVPFAMNAQKLNQRSVGTGSGSIPVLQTGGVLSKATIPAGTNADAFTLDADDTATGAISLTFGQSLNKTLTYDVPSVRFIFNSDVHIQGNLTVTGTISGERNVQSILQPHYPGAAFKEDGTNNVGQFSVVHDAGTKKSAYLWTSTKPSPQDFDLLLHVPVPAAFSRWGSIPLQLTYKTSAPAVDSGVDIRVYDTAGNPVSLSGGSLGLSAASWTTRQWSFIGTPVWMPGQSFLIRITPYARNTASVFIGDLELRTVEN